MKKLMSIAVAMAAGIVMATDGIESQNVVGYTAVGRGAGRYSASGSMFLSTGTTTYKLDDFKIEGTTTALTTSTCKRNFIAFLQGTAAKVDNAKAFYYFTNPNDTTQNGWKFKYASTDVNGDPVAADTYVADAYPDGYTIPANCGFICDFGTVGVQLVYAGEVQKGNENGQVTFDRPARYFYVSNPNPSRIDLTTMKIVGTTTALTTSTCKRNFIVAMQTGAAKVDNSKAYYYFTNPSDATQNGWKYKYASTDPNTGDTIAADSYVVEGTVFVEVGQAFLCDFGTTGTQIQFPAPL